MTSVPPHELAWAAGFMEGEGTVRINAITRRNKGALLVSTVNTDEALIDWFQARWPGYCKPAPGRPGRRDAWVWTIAANVARDFLVAIRPYVVSGRMLERIDLAVRWQELKAVHWRHRDEAWAEEHFALYLYSAELNARGVPA